MSQSVSKKPRKLIRCIYFYRRSASSPKILFAVLDDNYRYFQFSFSTFCGRFGVTLIRRFKNFFQNFKMNSDTDVVFSEEFKRGDPVLMYFNLIRDHLRYRMNILNLKKVVRGIARRHPRSVMTKREIEYHKRGTKNPSKIGLEHFNKVWKYMVSKKHGIKCPWITRDVDYQLQNKYPAEARRQMQLRLVMYYLALKNDFWNVEGTRDAIYAESVKKKEAEDPKLILSRL